MKRIICLLGCLLGSVAVFAQYNEQDIRNYIKQYADLEVQKMNELMAQIETLLVGAAVMLVLLGFGVVVIHHSERFKFQFRKINKNSVFL